MDEIPGNDFTNQHVGHCCPPVSVLTSAICFRADQEDVSSYGQQII